MAGSLETLVLFGVACKELLAGMSVLFKVAGKLNFKEDIGNIHKIRGCQNKAASDINYHYETTAY